MHVHDIDSKAGGSLRVLPRRVQSGAPSTPRPRRFGSPCPTRPSGQGGVHGQGHPNAPAAPPPALDLVRAVSCSTMEDEYSIPIRIGKAA